MQENLIADLTLRVGFSEKQHRTMIGPQEWVRIESYIKNIGKCQGCTYVPLSNEEAFRQLHVHFLGYLEGQAQYQCLCEACHFTQHIDAAIKKKLVLLVNSSLSQYQLVDISRNKTLKSSEDKIKILKKKPEELLKEINSGILKIDNRLKVIFNFDVLPDGKTTVIPFSLPLPL